MRNTIRLAACLGLVVAAPASAQSADDAGAYTALIFTPVGAAPPLLTAPMLNRRMTGVDFAVRYGHISFTGASANAFDGRLGIPLNPNVVVGLNAGYQGLPCEGGGCEGHFIAGGSIEGRLATLALGSYADAAKFTIGLNGEAGFGHRSGTSVYSLTGGLPFALVSGPPTVRIAPFLTPGMGFGRISDSGGERSGVRFLLAGGVIFESLTTGVGATVGFQKVFIENGETMFGVGLVLGAK